MIWSSVAVPPEADLVQIAKIAGAPEPERRHYESGRLYVAGVAQADLEAAVAKVGTAPIKPAPADLARTYKTDIWRRCTDAELQQLDAALEEAPAKLRRLWDDSTVIMHEAAEYPALRASVAAIVGDARADELLAASYFGG